MARAKDAIDALMGMASVDPADAGLYVLFRGFMGQEPVFRQWFYFELRDPSPLEWWAMMSSRPRGEVNNLLWFVRDLVARDFREIRSIDALRQLRSSDQSEEIRIHDALERRRSSLGPCVAWWLGKK